MYLILELMVYCGPEKFYGRSKFGQYDNEKNRDRFGFENYLKILTYV